MQRSPAEQFAGDALFEPWQSPGDEINPHSRMAVAVTHVDTSGLTCPLPLFKLRRALAILAPGTRVEVLSTDPLAPGDFAELCEAQGHGLIETRQNGSVALTVIVTAGDPRD